MWNTAIGSIGATARVLGDDVSYKYLMGVSATAFQLHFHQPEWCPSSPDATVGFDHSAPAMRALGYSSEIIHSDREKPEQVKMAKEAIVGSINRGFPVVAIDLISVPDWGVITGYADDGNEFFCRTYFDKTGGYSKAKKWPWVIMVIHERGPAPERRQSILESMAIAVTSFRTDAFGKYASGIAAYRKWAADLLDRSRFEKADGKEIGGYTHINGWCYRSLIDARCAATEYLKEIAREFEGQAGECLAGSAAIYGNLVDTLKAGLPNAPMPWTLKEGEQWIQEMREAEANVLKEAMVLEERAVAEIEKTLDLLND